MTYFKFFPKDLKIDGVQYKLGLNEHIEKIDTKPKYKSFMRAIDCTDINNLEILKVKR